MNKYPSPVILMLYGVVCITIGASLVYFAERYDKSFSSPPGPVADISTVLAPAQFISTIDLQRELNRIYPKLKLAEDGVYGPATKAAHERAIGDQYAKELR